mmetsp:Transcript_22099/g.35580  ORF Transcript_22099/g.35580 Transcript_22099/m.35580 type:complete len:112 (-) Transcript_22099:951-1286(-)
MENTDRHDREVEEQEAEAAAEEVVGHSYLISNTNNSKSKDEMAEVAIVAMTEVVTVGDLPGDGNVVVDMIEVGIPIVADMITGEMIGGIEVAEGAMDDDRRAYRSLRRSCL